MIVHPPLLPSVLLGTAELLRLNPQERITEAPALLEQAAERLIALERAARFGLLVLREFRDDLGDLDGGWLQDTAEECGLLHRVTVTEPCGDVCWCAEYDDFPQMCRRITEEVLALENERAK